MDENDNSNCPDCQLQFMQQQDCGPTSLIARHNHKTAVSAASSCHDFIGGKSAMGSINSGADMQRQIRTSTSHWDAVVSCVNGRMESHHRIPDDNIMCCPTSSRQHGIETSANNANNVVNINSGLPYTSSNNYSSHQQPSISSANIPVVNVPLGPSSQTQSGPPSSNDIMSTTNACLTSMPEGCSGYCAACAVLELPLPPNDKYYRSALSRHAVFPPIFYTQPPPIPGFSPIPECSLWSGCNSNDFPTFTYPAYPQQATTGDYFSNSGGFVSPHVSSTQEHSINPMDPMTVNTNIGGGYSASTSRYKLNSTDEAQKLRDETDKGSVVNEIPSEGNHQVFIPSSNSISDESSSSYSESCFSEKELIVEDDDEEDERVSISICNFDRNQKCIVCHASIIADCSSPHLENILETIDDDITAEDLDITVSSADIEIGGIEDEVRTFHQKKISGGPHCTSMLISWDRLAQLIGVSSQTLQNENKNSHDNNINLMVLSSQEFSHDDEQMVLFCNKCGKLATLADSLEKQLSSTTQILQELYCRKLKINTNTEEPKSLSSERCDSSISTKVDTLLNRSTERYQNSDVIYDIKESTKQLELDPFKTLALPVDQLQAKSVSTQTNPVLFSESLIQTDVVFPEVDDANTFPCSVIEFENIHIPIPKSPVVIKTGDMVTPTNVNSYNVPQPENVNPADDDAVSIHSNASLRLLADEVIMMETVNTNNIITDYHSLEETQEKNANSDPLSHNKISGENSSSEQVVKDYSHSGIIYEDSEITKENTIPVRQIMKNKIAYVCELCGKQMSSKRSLFQHLHRHESPDVLKCLECSLQFENKVLLVSHTRTHQSTKSSSISNLSSSSPSVVVLEKEVCKEFSKKQIPQPVDITTEKELEKTSLSKDDTSLDNNNECLVSEENKNICSRCGLHFRHKERFKKHVSGRCKSKALQCPQCDKKFAKASELRAHRRIHEGQKPFACEVCNLTFATKGNQVSHSRVHLSFKRFTCHICQKGFNRKLALECHLNVHNGVKPYSCSECNSSFHSPSNLISHKRNHPNLKK